jgi:hypothetical protein
VPGACAARVCLGDGENQLRSVGSLYPTDALAVGWSKVGGVHQTLTAHWDGTSWSGGSQCRHVRRQLAHNYVRGEAAVTSTDVWAAGYSSTTTYQTVTEHWDGSSWPRVPRPNA